MHSLVLLLSLSLSAAVPIKAGEPAPYAGQLLTTEEAVELLKDSEARDADIKREQKKAEERLQIELKALAAEAELDKAELRKAYEIQLDLVKPKWFENPIIVAVGTVIVTGIVLYAYGNLPRN